VHYKAIAGEGFKVLEEGDAVEFNVEQGPNPTSPQLKKEANIYKYLSIVKKSF